MKIFTVSFAGAESGAALSRFAPAEGVEIWAVLIGEQGRGRRLGVLPYKGSVDPAKPIVLAAAIGTSRTGRPVLIPDVENRESGDAIVVARTQHGFRGSGRVTGKFMGWGILRDHFDKWDAELYPTEDAARQAAVESGKYWYTVRPRFAEYAPKVLVDGVVADGVAGNMASAVQVVFIARPGDEFCLYRTGRLYGGEPFVQFKNNAGVIQQVTEWDEL